MQPHLDTLKALAETKAPVVLVEWGHPLRGTQTVLNNIIVYDVFEKNDPEDNLVLFLGHRDTGPTSPQPLAGGAKPKTSLMRHYIFHWVPVASIIKIEQDAGIEIDTKNRRIVREDIPPIYTDGMQNWERMNAGVIYHIERTLHRMGLRSEPPSPPGAPKPAGTAPQIAPPAQPVAADPGDSASAPSPPPVPTVEEGPVQKES